MRFNEVDSLCRETGIIGFISALGSRGSLSCDNAQHVWVHRGFRSQMGICLDELNISWTSVLKPEQLFFLVLGIIMHFVAEWL